MAGPESPRWKTIGPRSLPALPSTPEILHRAFRAESALPEFLQSAATSGQSVLLLINDGHRSTLTRPALEAMAELTAGLTRPPHFRVVVATGTHQFAENERSAFEGATLDQCGLSIDDIAWHEASEARSLTEVAGVLMHRWLAESRYLLPIGSIEPHYFAGLTGPHKTVTIGCMAGDGIQRNHALAMSPAARILQLRGNPVFDDVVRVLDGLRRCGKRICAVGEVVCDNALIAVAVGDPLETIAALKPMMEEVYVHTLAQPVDILRLRVPWPLGRNLYQAHKAIENNAAAVRDGGGILLEAACPEGVGPDAFLRLLRQAGDYTAARQIVENRGYVLGDHKAVRLRYLTDPRYRGIHISLACSSISAEDANVCGMRLFGNVEAGLAWLADVISPTRHNALCIEDAGVLTVSSAELGDGEE